MTDITAELPSGDALFVRGDQGKAVLFFDNKRWKVDFCHKNSEKFIRHESSYIYLETAKLVAVALVQTLGD